MSLLMTLLIISPWMRGQWPPLVAYGGAAAFILYSAITGLAGVFKLGKNRTTHPKPRAGGELVTCGIYAILRHPFYASMMAFGCGWALLWSSFAGALLAPVFMLYLHAKTRFEEKLLHKAYPGYADYAKRVPRYLPHYKALRNRSPDNGLV